jgi:hypothetical protein
MADFDPEGPAKASRDNLVEDYRTILNELALLTTVSVLLFGFLLTSANIANSEVEEWAYAVALILVATATLVFVLPVPYHHLQYPYRDFEKFQHRTHIWMRAGLPLLGSSFYLTLVLAITPLFDAAAIIVAAVPLIATLIVFFARKVT